MNLTYSGPTNKIPARIPYHFHVEANKRFVCATLGYSQCTTKWILTTQSSTRTGTAAAYLSSDSLIGLSTSSKFTYKCASQSWGWEMTLICSTHTVQNTIQNSTHNLVEQFLARSVNSYSCWCGIREETKGSILSNSEQIYLTEVCPVQHTTQVILVTLGWLELQCLITHKKFQQKNKIIQEIRNMLANQISYVKSILNDCQFLTAWRTWIDICPMDIIHTDRLTKRGQWDLF